MKHKPKPRGMRKATLRMADNHTWKAPPGYQIVVLDRGAVSFNVPHQWVLTKLEPVEIYDREPPDDESRLSVSFWRLPPGIDWSGLPLEGMLRDATRNLGKDVRERGDIITLPRDDIELAWTYYRFLDPNVPREAYSRIAIARGWDVQALFTFDFWVDDLKRCQPAWNELLRSIQLGRRIEDPTRGPVLH